MTARKSMANDKSTGKPVIGITADVTDRNYQVGRSYVRMVEQAGGMPLILPPLIDSIPAYMSMCDGLIFSGGDDPITTHWGVPLHPKATPLHPDRQAFEVALLKALDERRDMPALGICLGM